MRIEIQDFGPIREGAFTLKPLTVFIGPNNSGKSYAAMLAYVFAGVEEWFRGFRAESGRLHHDEENELFRRQLDHELQRCFAGEPGSLVRESARTFSVRFSDSVFPCMIRLDEGEFKLAPLEEPPRPAAPPPEERAGAVSLAQLAVIRHLVRPWVQQTHYLPGGRSGILQMYRTWARAVVRDLPLWQLAGRPATRITGTLADFIGQLLILDQATTGIPAVAEHLEGRLCDGSIELEGGSNWEYPEIVYRRRGFALPIHRASAMILEAAPIVLFLKHVVRCGDTLIIEEPEAHLHPAGQLIMARAIARLVNAGVRVLITTHSDYLLHELSNLVKLSAAADAADSLGWAPEEVLRPDQVAVYLFSFEKDASGSSVKELKVTAQEGIPEEEFGRVAEALYQKSTRLEYVRLQSE